MPRKSAAVAAETARSILRTATELFAAEGFGQVALDQVAGAAGVTRGAVYHHYRNKYGLFTAVAADCQAAVAKAVVGAAGEQADPVTSLRNGCHGFLDAITTGAAARILLVEAPAVLGWQQWRALDAEHSVVHLRDALAEAGVELELLDATTAQLSGAMNEAALWLIEEPDQTAAAHQVLDRLIDSVLG